MVVDMVLVRVVRNLTDMHAGDEAWVEENDRVVGMVDGGYWEIADRKPAARTAKKGSSGGEDPAELA